LYLKDPEPEVNITTTPQSSESELDETSSLVCNLVVDASQIANVEHSEINLTDFALFADVVLGLGHVGAETVFS
jgi:hypothetical protein